MALGADKPAYRATLETLMSANSALFILTLAITGLAAWIGSKRAGKAVSFCHTRDHASLLDVDLFGCR